MILFNDYEFVFNKMNEFNPLVYNTADFELFKVLDHKCYVEYDLLSKIIAFGCVIFIDDIPYMTYTWNDGTFTGKKAYLKGIDSLHKLYPNMVYMDTAMTFNKIKRITNAK